MSPAAESHEVGEKDSVGGGHASTGAARDAPESSRTRRTALAAIVASGILVVQIPAK